MKKLSIALTFAVAICGAVCVAAQQTPSVDEILAKYVTALGGRDAILKQTSRHVKGTIEIEGQQGQGTAESYAKAPNKYVATIAFPGIGESKRGFDGQSAWISEGGQPAQDLTGKDLASMQRASDMFQALDIKKSYPKLAMVGTESVEGKPAYVIEGDPGDGSLRRMYFDVASGLMVRNIEATGAGESQVSVATDIHDYRDANGIKYPYTLVQHTHAPDGTTSALTIRIAEVHSNVPIDDGVFKKPAN